MDGFTDSNDQSRAEMISHIISILATAEYDYNDALSVVFSVYLSLIKQIESKGVGRDVVNRVIEATIEELEKMKNEDRVLH